MSTAIKTAPLSRLFRAEWTQWRLLRSPEDSADRGETRTRPFNHAHRSARRGFFTDIKIDHFERIFNFDRSRSDSIQIAFANGPCAFMLGEGDTGLLDNAWSANFRFRFEIKSFSKVNFIRSILFNRFDSLIRYLKSKILFISTFNESFRSLLLV